MWDPRFRALGLSTEQWGKQFQSRQFKIKIFTEKITDVSRGVDQPKHDRDVGKLVFWGLSKNSKNNDQIIKLCVAEEGIIKGKYSV